MSADFTPEKEDYHMLTPFKMQVLTNFPYIEADFDALTNYQLLCKVVEYLNNVIANENEVTEQVTSLYNAYVSLQHYVNTRIDGLESYMNNYFNNLDVQEEINNKLDAMATDGSLTNLIKNYVDPIYEEYEDTINLRVDNQDLEISNFKTGISNEIATINNKVNLATAGTPLVASSTSGMTDTTKVYVNTTDGKWYYYNGTTWTIGGTYQATGVSESDPVIVSIKNDINNTYNVIIGDFSNTAVNGSTGAQTNAASNRASNDTLIEIENNHILKVSKLTDTTYIEVYKFRSNVLITKEVLSETNTYITGDQIRILIQYTDNSDISLSDIEDLIEIKDYNNNLVNAKNVVYNNNLLVNQNLNEGYYNNSGVHSNTSYHYFQKIPVKANTLYTVKPKARFVVVQSGTTVVDFVNDDNITSFTPSVNGDLYITFYKSDSIDTYKLFESSELDSPNINQNYLSNSILLTPEQLNQKSNILYGKKWVACGDSFTHGAFTGETDPYTFEDSPYQGELKVYPFIIGRRNNMIIINEAISGSTMTNINGAGERNPFSLTRYQNIPNDADYITLYFGINDYNYNAPIGTINDNTTSTFYGAWNTVLSYLIEHHPKAKIGIIITNGSMEGGLQTNYTAAEIAIAKKYGLSYLNLATDDQVPYFCRQWERTDVSDSIKRERDEYYQVSTTNFHPNVKAHEYESTFIEEFLRRL